MKKNLIIARVGDRSLHKHWIDNKSACDFDLMLSYYGDTPGKYRDDAEIYLQQKGGKWPIIHQHVSEHWQIIEQYDAVWFPDDDLLADTETLNRMFAFFKAFDLSLAQPALTLNSYFAWASLIQRKSSYLRFVNFVEVMAPIFKVAVLKGLVHTLAESRTGWGLDTLWPNIIKNENRDKIAVIDATPIVHTRPLGGELYKNNPDLSGDGDIAHLKTLYPDLDIKRTSKANKFRVFGQVFNRVRHGDLLPYLVGKYQRLHTLKLANKVEKYNSK